MKSMQSNMTLTSSPQYESAPKHTKFKNMVPAKLQELQDLDFRRTDIVNRINETTTEKDNLFYKFGEQPPIEVEFQKGESTLKDLAIFGNELITNVSVSTEKYELLRRQAEEIRRIDLDEKISDESKITLAKFDEILARWSELADVKEPMALFEELETLKQKVSQLMDSKKTIIERCQDECKRLNEQYQLDQARHDISLCCLVERIDNHVEVMNNAYKDQIETLSVSLDNDRKQKFLDAVAEWHNAFDETMQSQNEKLLLRNQKRDYYANEIKLISKKQEEMTHATRVRLEKDAELLQLELRKAHNNALLNSEKLDYNYNVLQNSSMEKTIILNQQKRRLAKLTEHIGQMKKQIIENKSRGEAQILKTVADIEKLQTNISNLEEKNHGIQKQKTEQYKRCWDMNYKEAVTLIEKIFNIDKTIHEQQLLVPWKPLKIESIYVPVTNYQQNFKTILGSTNSNISKKSQLKKTKSDKIILDKAETRLLRHILRILPDRTGFLIESPLQSILESHSENQQNIIKIDTVFSVLNIYNIEDMRALAKHFKPYMFCPNCTQKVSDDFLKNIFKNRFFYEYEETMYNKDCPSHFLVMDPAIVLSALNTFMEDHREMEARLDTTEKYSKRTSKLLGMSTREIKEFWNNLESNVPKKGNNLWKAVEHGLNHYIEVLKKREELYKECSLLKRQNFELKHFLKQFH